MFNGTYYIETYGCQMNEHDSEKMAAMLEDLGMAQVWSAEDADVVVINTCSIREKAEHKVYSALGKLKHLKRKNPGMVIAVAGCVAQQGKSGLLAKIRHLDAVVGTHRIGELPEIVRRVQQRGERIEASDFSPDVASLHIPAPRKGRSPVCSYVTIMQGCSNFCSYCVVPYTRGPEQSRPLQEVVVEVEALANSGVREVTLLGQNVNAYGKDLGDGTSFVRLLDELDGVPGLSRIRFTTSHPKDFSEALAERMASLGSVCEHIHLPLQSGSDRVLLAMGRGYTRARYIEKIETLRRKVPGAAITADIIVGFPGETEEDFNQTMLALEEIRFDQIFSFKFSQRPGTRARNLPDQVPDEEKSARLAKVHELQDRITLEYHRDAEGSVYEILIEGIKHESGQVFGRTRTNKIVNVSLSDSVRTGDLTRVKITKGLKHSLFGEFV